MWKKSIVERGRLQMAIWRKWVSCWITNATNAHTECVVLLLFFFFGFPLQQLQERATMFRHMYGVFLLFLRVLSCMQQV